ncbi:MAG: DNA methyltransferase, partial [Phycisphaerales bacterium]
MTKTTTAPSKRAPRKKPYDRVHPENGARARVYVGDCREVLPRLAECKAGEVDLIFADPPFNWSRDYDRHKVGGAWKDSMPDAEYCDPDDSLRALGESTSFTMQWLDACIQALAPHGSMWVNIPDDWAAEIALHLKRRGLHLINWNVWHYRFGQNQRNRFILSKVHVLYFCKDPSTRIWRPDEVLEVSDRRSIYFDPRTESKKDGMPAGMRVPMDVWYGQYWGRIQG